MKKTIAKEETVDIQKELLKQGSKRAKYQELILGERGFLKLLKYELITGLSGWMPGALGLLMRSKLYPRLLGYVGRNVTFGKGVVLRHPYKIKIGDNVVIDDHCVLDAKGQDNRGIFIGSGVYIGRNTILNCKNGDIVLESNVNISANCMIFSASEVRVGANFLMAAYCYLVGGTHHFDDLTLPVIQQKRSSRGIVLEPGGWLGAHVTVMDGVRLGKHAVIGAGSVVNRNIPDYAVAAGVPVTFVNKRKPPEAPYRSRKTVSVAVINYNGEEYLEDTFDSVFGLDYPAVQEVFLVDNASSDGSVDLVRKKFPKVKILETGANLGACAARNVAIREAKSELIFLLDKDVAFPADVLSRLEEGFHTDPEAGIVSAQICYYDNPEKIQYNGAHIHFAGGAIQNKLEWHEPVRVSAVTAIGLLVDCAKAVEIGLYDEDFFYGWEDGDFSYRMTIAGYPCYVDTQAKVYHKKAKRGLHWVHFQVRNRWWFILKTYNFRTLVVSFPAIFLYQLAIMGFLTVKGHLGGFIKGMWGVFRSLPAVWRKRKDVMKRKKVRDRQVLSAAGIDLIGDVEAGGVLNLANRMINGLFALYWVFARWFVK